MNLVVPGPRQQQRQTKARFPMVPTDVPYELIVICSIVLIGLLLDWLDDRRTP